MKMLTPINKLMLVIIISLSAVVSNAQNPSIPAAVTAELKKIQQGYEQAAFMKFNVFFSYALESEPYKYLDSMSGTYYINGKNYYGQLGYTEYIQNEFFNVTVFKEEKLITLAKSTGSGLASFLFSGWDSVMIANTVAAASIGPDSIDNNNGIIRFDYVAGSPYQQSIINYNKSTLMVNYIIYISDRSMGTPADGLGEESVNRIIVKIDFRNYQTGDFTKEVFDHLRFLKKENNEWILQELYKEYQFYLSSVDL